MVCIKVEDAELRMKTLKEEGTILKVKRQIQISEAKEVIKKALSNSSNPVVAFSGGKDSLVVIDLVRKIDPSVRGVFGNTGVEYPETVEFVKTFDNIVELHPEKTFWQIVREEREAGHGDGFPGVKSKSHRRENECCHWLKEKPSKEYYKKENIDLVFTGITADESRNRMMMLKFRGSYYKHKNTPIYKCHPIAFWSESDVWNYIKTNNLAYNPVYDTGMDRTGCRYCTAYPIWKTNMELYDPKDVKLVMRKKGYRLLDVFA